MNNDIVRFILGLSYSCLVIIIIGLLMGMKLNNFIFVFGINGLIIFYAIIKTILQKKAGDTYFDK